MLVLASGSPRRISLLLAIGLEADVDPARVEESIPKGSTVEEAVLTVAGRKLDVVAKRHKGQTILAADTVIEFEGDVIGKPKFPADAEKILKRLSGNTHRAVTGVIVQGTDGKRHSAAVSTEVEFAKIGTEQLRAYVGTGEPLDKAGGYAIQGAGGAFVREIRGDYTNVVGLPIRRTLELLEAAGYHLPDHLRPG